MTKLGVWIGLVSFCSLTGCGDAGGVRFASSSLAAETARLALYYFESTATCTALLTSSDRSAALHGPFPSDALSEDDRAEGLDLPVQVLPSGTYVVVVDAIDGSNTLIGSGCAEGQQVLEQRASFTEIVIYPVE